MPVTQKAEPKLSWPQWGIDKVLKDSRIPIYVEGRHSKIIVQSVTGKAGLEVRYDEVLRLEGEWTSGASERESETGVDSTKPYKC